MAGAVRIEQTHKALLNCRFKVVVEKSFSVCQAKILHQFPYRELTIADSSDNFAYRDIIRNQLVGYLWGQLVGSACGVSLHRILFVIVGVVNTLHEHFTVTDLVGESHFEQRFQF